MNNISRQDLVLLLTKKATEKDVDTPGIMGRKALQKSFYFLNQHDDFFTFKWHDYGPFSGELQQITKDLVSNGNISLKEIQTKKQDAIINHMTFSDDNNPYFSEEDIPKEIHSRMNQVLTLVMGRKPRELELLASVHYWAKKEQFALDSYSPEYIHGKLTELKPDAGFTMPDVIRAIETLEHFDYLCTEISE